MDSAFRGYKVRADTRTRELHGEGPQTTGR